MSIIRLSRAPRHMKIRKCQMWSKIDKRANFQHFSKIPKTCEELPHFVSKFGDPGVKIELFRAKKLILSISKNIWFRARDLIFVLRREGGVSCQKYNLSLYNRTFFTGSDGFGLDQKSRVVFAWSRQTCAKIVFFEPQKRLKMGQKRRQLGF